MMTMIYQEHLRSSLWQSLSVYEPGYESWCVSGMIYVNQTDSLNGSYGLVV